MDDPAVLSLALTATTTGTTDDGPDVEERVMVAGALARLTPRQQQLVQLRFVDGLTQHEIGQIIGVSQMQVSGLLRQVVTVLTRLLSSHPQDTDLACAS